MKLLLEPECEIEILMRGFVDLQNHRIIGWKRPLRSSSPTICPLLPATWISDLYSQEVEMYKMQNHPETCFPLSLSKMHSNMERSRAHTCMWI